MRVGTHINGLFEHYFTKKYTTASGYSLFDKSLWPIGVGSILAFFSIGFGSVTIFNTTPSILFIALGIFGFGATVVLHCILVALGLFYKRGVFSTIKWSVFVVLTLIAGSLAIGFMLYGGIFISAFVFLVVIPVDTILIPFNIIGFITGSIWWYMKGLSIIDGPETPGSAFQGEIRLFNWIFNVERSE
jgi:hypothetical protein